MRIFEPYLTLPAKHERDGVAFFIVVLFRY